MTEVWDIGGMALTLRTVSPSDLGQLVALTSHECWDISLEELRIMHEAEPSAFVGLFLEDGTLICHICMVLVSELFAYLGLFVTSKPYRGRGIGRRLFEYTQEVTKPRTLTLDAVPGNTQLYEASGFKSAGVDIHRIEGKMVTSCLAENVHEDPKIIKQPIGKTDLEEISEYDASVSGRSRKKFLDLWLTSPRSVAVLARDAVTRAICGYLVMREDHHRRKTGPVYKGAGFYADSAVIAVQLLREVFLKHLPPQTSFWFEYPAVNHNAPNVIHQFGNTSRDDFVVRKMVSRGTMPAFQWTKIYNIANTFNSCT